MSDAVRELSGSIMPDVDDNHHFAVPYPVADNVDVVIADADATDDSSELSATLSDNAINALAPAEQHDLISKTFDLQWKSTATQQEWEGDVFADVDQWFGPTVRKLSCLPLTHPTNDKVAAHEAM
jgi:hypothetical protein